MTMTCEIPVWVNGVEKWVTGVGRRTTCGDLVRALLTGQLCSDADAATPTHADLLAHSVVECWRKVERPLEPGVKIQRVLRTWGDDTADVTFTLKRLDPPSAGQVVPRRRRHSRGHRGGVSGSRDQAHPSKLTVATASKPAAPNVVERLMQTILVQGETIAEQLRQLREREHRIGYYEHKLHRVRERRLGPDYLLRAYLRDGDDAGSVHDKSSHDSDVGAELAADADVTASRGDVSGTAARDVSEEEAVTDLQQTLLYLERIVELNARICEHEQAALRVGERAAVDDDDAAGEASQTLLELEISRAELQRLTTVCARQSAQIERNERSLVKCERQLEWRRRYLRHLEYELDGAEVDERRLLADGQRLMVRQQRLVVTQQSAVQAWAADPPASYANPVYTCAPVVVGRASKDSCAIRDADSNSDTGLSSLHSSGDEMAVAHVLDTLV